jgi:gamma-glutamyltranspeptidase/glutathione hydrolase
LTIEDLASHKSIWEEPLSYAYEDITLHEMPPNGQGLAALIALGILKHLELRRFAIDSAYSIHLQIEAMKIATRKAFEHIADSDSMEVDPQDLLNDDVLARYASQIDLHQAQFPRLVETTGGGTVYLTTADKKGDDGVIHPK